MAPSTLSNPLGFVNLKERNHIIRQARWSLTQNPIDVAEKHRLLMLIKYQDDSADDHIFNAVHQRRVRSAPQKRHTIDTNQQPVVQMQIDDDDDNDDGRNDIWQRRCTCIDELADLEAAVSLEHKRRNSTRSDPSFTPPQPPRLRKIGRHE